MRIISGSLKNRAIASPSHKFRPTQSVVREAIFNIVDVEGLNFVDLFAGSGSVGFEALSRGAKSVSLVDISDEAIKCMRKTAEGFGVKEDCRIIKTSAIHFAKTASGSFDIIFADPPYFIGGCAILYETIVNRNLLTENGVLILEMHDKDKEIEKLESLSFKSRSYGKSTLLFMRLPS